MMKLNNGKKKTNTSNIWWFSTCSVQDSSSASVSWTVSLCCQILVGWYLQQQRAIQKDAFSLDFKRSHPILSTLGPNELSYFFLIKDTKESFASFPVQIHVNSTARIFKVYLTGETQRFIQIGRSTLRVVVHKMNPRKSDDQHDTSEGRVFQSAFTCIKWLSI